MGVSEISFMKATRSLTGIREISSMFLPPTVTESASLRSRLPPQAEQGMTCMYSSYSGFTDSAHSR